MIFQSSIITLTLSALALILSGYCAWQMVSINRLKKAFFAGEKAASLENVIYSLKQELKNSRAQEDALGKALMDLKSKTAFAIQRVGLVRFNPFNDGGGNFSFTLALLDDYNSGVIITSMYGREQNRIYTKKIEQGKCDIKLTEEEEQAISRANDK
jgi:Protein of unknown function (DUF4446)